MAYHSTKSILTAFATVASFAFVCAGPLTVAEVSAKGSVPFQGGTAPVKSVNGGANDPATQQALIETQDALIDPEKRAKMLEGDTQAQIVDAQLKAKLGGQSEGAYQIAAKLMETVVQEGGGDPVKMQEIVNKLMANPHLLEKYLSPAERAQIKHMAGQIEAEKGNARLPASR